MLSCGMSYIRATLVPSLWQLPHMMGMLKRFTRETSWDGGMMSCAPWQSQQWGASGFPAATARPCRLWP